MRDLEKEAVSRPAVRHVSPGNRPEDRYKVRPSDEFVSNGREGGKRLPPHKSKGKG